ncbi:alpha/beta fold hydrolase [Aeoliella mucimassa]|uniref:2-hydroxy-6-oxo-6-phenylhexa-2,4-dienoate hydrolase n=1 Tax=Aeoliella mucimassa TaxID=2527972 RepID=A0A518AMI2_9BACT|nr:alpha/beta hydrolase [Aeoliella mucimassa]QDU55945.1 2-hydroxy-6-oxo-6-phenylhexa-2,4-dienoate hydrolase [Aeoliella mucimassa]
MVRILLLAVCAAMLAGSAYGQAPVEGEAITFDENLKGYPYPFEVKNYAFHSQGRDLQMAYMYLPAKDPAKGVVTLLHGKNFNGAYWQQTAEYLQSLGYGVLMPDQIGFGKSTKATSYQYSFAVLAQNTKQLMQSLGIEKSIVVGHSMGGMLASRFALLYPEATTQLILVNPIGLENYLQYVQYKDVQFFFENELGSTPEKIVEYQKKNYYDGAWNGRYAALTLPLVGWVQGDDWNKLAYVSALTYDMIFTQPVVEEFKDFQVPTTLIIGTRDRTGPGRNWMKPGVEFELGRYDLIGERIQQRNPNIKVVELDGLGHLPHIEDFTRFKMAFTGALQP